MTVGPGETADVRPAQHDHVAAARGLGRHPLRRRLRRVGLRGLARRVDRHRHGRRPRRAGGGGGGDRLGDEPHRRRTGAPDHARRRGAVDAAAGRHRSRSSARRRPAPRARSPSSARPARSTRCPRTPLEVLDVRPTGACAGVTFAVASRHPSSRVDGGCPGRHVHGDVLGARRAGSTHERRARRQLLLDLQGYPEGAGERRRRPRTATAALTLRVDPGEARLAYPALTGSSSARTAGRGAVRRRRRRARDPGAQRRAARLRGVRREQRRRVAHGVRTTAWAYDPPPAPPRSPARPSSPAATAASSRSRSTGIDPAQTGSLEITSATGETVRVPVGAQRHQLDVPSYRVGTNTATPITVTPFSRFDVPPGLGGATPARADCVGQRHRRPAGSRAPRSARPSNGDGTSTVTAHGGARSAATARRCATASCASGSAADGARRLDGRVHRPPGRRGVLVHRVRRVLVRRHVVRPRRP